MTRTTRPDDPTVDDLVRAARFPVLGVVGHIPGAEICVDGEAVEFERLRLDGIEAAGAVIGDVRVTLVSRDRPLAELALERLRPAG